MREKTIDTHRAYICPFNRMHERTRRRLKTGRAAEGRNERRNIVDGFDLSVGSTASLATIASASALVLHRQELFVALIIPLLLGVLIGLCNAFLTIQLRLPVLSKAPF